MGIELRDRLRFASLVSYLVAGTYGKLLAQLLTQRMENRHKNTVPTDVSEP
jgi:hypothetical protein